jgi:hypothetical protein
VRRTPAGIRIKTRNGYDWTNRYPLITKAAEGAARDLLRARRRRRDPQGGRIERLRPAPSSQFMIRSRSRTRVVKRHPQGDW